MGTEAINGATPNDVGLDNLDTATALVAIAVMFMGARRRHAA